MVGFLFIIEEVNSWTHRYSYGLLTNNDSVLLCYRLRFVSAVIKVNRQKCWYFMFRSYSISALMQLGVC